MIMQRIEIEWLAYRSVVIPSDASEIQITESKKAFFAGAVALWDLLWKELKHPESLFTANDYEKVEQLATEVDEFKDKVRKGII